MVSGFTVLCSGSDRVGGRPRVAAIASHRSRHTRPVPLQCAPRHSLARWQRANPDTRIKSDGFGECGLSDVSDVSSAIIGSNVEAAPTSAAYHGRCHRRRAARCACLWLAPRVWYLLKIARLIDRRMAASSARSSVQVLRPSRTHRTSSIHNAAVPPPGAISRRSPGPGQAAPARRSQSFTGCAMEHSPCASEWNKLFVGVRGFLSCGGKPWTQSALLGFARIVRRLARS